MAALQGQFERGAAGPMAIPATLVRVLTWPVIGLLITGAVHFTVEAIWPDLRTFFVPPVLAVILLAYGGWVGVRSIGLGGVYLTAIVAAAILGLLPVALDIIGFGILLDRGVSNGVLGGVFGWTCVLFGSLLGAGFVLSGRDAARG